MTRIALLADTHQTSYDGDLGEEVAQYLTGVDLILHAGDVYASSVLDWFETFAPVVVARGNGDETLDADRRVKDVQVLESDGVHIGSRHWFDFPLRDERPLAKRTDEIFGRPVDVVVFGDTHTPVVERCGRVLLINPGSPTVPGQMLNIPGTMAILEISAGKASASLIKLQQAIPLKLRGNREPLLRKPRLS